MSAPSEWNVVFRVLPVFLDLALSDRPSICKLTFAPMKHHAALAAILMVALAARFEAQQKPSAPAPTAKPGPDSQLYRSSAFGFRYKIPYGWVDRTKEMQAENESTKGGVLLAVFQRPPQAAGDTINSAVVIATEDTISHPELKTADDYLGLLNEITEAKGFKPAGDPADITIDGHALLRADYTKAMNEKLTMYQTTLVMLEKGQIVLFTFIAGSDDEINDLMESLSFSPAAARH